jgi:hypothetical protein
MIMIWKRTRTIVLLAWLLGAPTIVPAVAQTSASYRLQESSFNNGGNPGRSGALASAHFRVSLDAVGEDAARAGTASASIHVDGGFVAGLTPPGEVTGLRFTDATTLRWNPERSADRYELYRGLVASLPGTYGACLANDLAAQTTSDASLPSTGQGFFYMVTARNRLREEGPKGFRSGGIEEANPLPCP